MIRAPGESILINLTKCHAVDVCPPHVQTSPVTEWVVIVVYELSNIMKMVGDDLKIHQTFSACLTLKNTLDESVS
jgi:hypothetical protein